MGNQQGIAIIQSVYPDDSDQGDRNDRSRNWLDSGWILKLILVRPPDELDVGYARNGVVNDTWAFWTEQLVEGISIKLNW